MPIAGVIIAVNPDHTNETLKELKNFKKVTTYGVHQKNMIVAVFEAESSEELHQLSRELTRKIPSILGIYPAYVNYEDQI